MVLYECVSTYHLLCAMVDQSLHPEQQATLLYFDGMKNRGYPVDKLKLLFNTIIPYELGYEDTHSDHEVIRYFCGLLGIKNPKQMNYERIYCNGTTHGFAFFLALTKTPFIYCEDGAGLLSEPEVLLNIDKGYKGRQHIIPRFCEYGLYDGTNENIIIRRCNIKAQHKDFTCENVEDFDVVEKLSLLEPEARNNIIKFFITFDTIHCQNDAVLVLTQHFANLKILSFEQQVQIYQYIKDYFFAHDHLVIKPHPDDIMYYSKLFPDSELIKVRFPSEFIPFVLEPLPKCIATISSTAIRNLRGHCKTIFELDTRYEKAFEYTHRYYAAIKVAQTVKKDIVCIGANEKLLERLVETVDGFKPRIISNCEQLRDNILIIDDITDEGENGRTWVQSILMEKASCAVFLNTMNDYCWYNRPNRELWKNFAQYILLKEPIIPISEDQYEDLEEEVIYLYSKNEKILSDMKSTSIKKELPHVGILLKGLVLSGDEERISMLEGILAATEKRLNYYIEQEKNQQEDQKE